MGWVPCPATLEESSPSPRSLDLKGRRARLDSQVHIHHFYSRYQNPGWRDDLLNITGHSAWIWSGLKIQLTFIEPFDYSHPSSETCPT